MNAAQWTLLILAVTWLLAALNALRPARRDLTSLTLEHHIERRTPGGTAVAALARARHTAMLIRAQGMPLEGWTVERADCGCRWDCEDHGDHHTPCPAHAAEQEDVEQWERELQ